MTREEAIRCLSVHSSTNGSVLCTDEQHYEAKQMAIQALSQEPCEDWYDVPSDEMTLEQARQAVKDLRKKLAKNLPPVTPQQKTGRWFIDERPESDREVICSNCEQPVFKYHKLGFDYRPKYCPNCGAKMVEPQESEKINCKSTKCENCINHNYCDYESQESEE